MSQAQQQTTLLAGILAAILQANGLTMTCAQLQANAATYACIPPQLLVPALIWVILNGNGGGTPSPIQVLSGNGDPVVANPTTPTASNAIYTDTSVPGQWGLWSWANSTWTNLIAN
jgi:hypothetical protein